ncbi:MAG: hypothetical protein E7468_02070 [Ruminococcaceae bacterium]|nr:hypothetical protein [Oscillospiraceae bacterium]
MKKYLPYFLFSAIALIISLVLSFLFDFSLSNTWQACVALLLVFGPLWICGWKEVCVQKHKHPVICFLARFYLILVLVGYLISTLVFLIVGF